jgi:hypothetical protein
MGLQPSHPVAQRPQEKRVTVSIDRQIDAVDLDLVARATSRLLIQIQRTRLSRPEIDALDRFTASRGRDIPCPRIHEQMPSTAIANLLDDGVADTLELVGATCGGVHADVPINDLDSARSHSSPAPGCGVHRGREAGVDFCGIERRHGFGCWKGYGHAVLVADPRHAAR